MARTQTMVQLTDDLVKQLDEEAARRQMSRSALIRSVLTTYLETESEAAKVARYVEGYRRIPQGTADEWGVVEEQVVAGTHEAMRRMEAEEEAIGFSW